MMQADDDASGSSRTGKDAKHTKTTPRVTRVEDEGDDVRTTGKGKGGCGFWCFKFKEKNTISALEFKMANRQKQFGQ
jgi:hypothetical protein